MAGAEKHDSGFQYRLRLKLKDLEMRRGGNYRVTQEELAAMVTARLGRKKPYTSVTAYHWMRGRRPPYEAMVALAAVLSEEGGPKVDPGWLAFGTPGADAAYDAEMARLSVAQAAVSRRARQAGDGASGRRRPGRSS